MDIINCSTTSISVTCHYAVSTIVKQPLSAYVNGQKVGETKVPAYSFTNLMPDTHYELQLKNKEINECCFASTLSAQLVLDVTQFNAKGDGLTNDTLAIQSTIAFAPEHSIINFVAGVYLIDTIYLKSNITLLLQKGAILLGRNKIDEMPIIPGHTEHFSGGSWEGVAQNMHPALITIMYATNVLITGEGLIDGGANANTWWDQPLRDTPATRPRTIFIGYSDHVIIEGITVKNSPSWTIHPFCSRDLSFFNLNISNPDPSPNTDGLNPEFCQNIQIIGVHFTVGDDCIAIKAGRKELADLTKIVTKHIKISHCFMEKGHGGIVMGSEMSGGVEDIFVENCYFYQTDRGIRLKTRRGRGGYVRNIHVDHIEMDQVMAPIVMNMFYNCCDPDRDTEYVWSKESLKVDERTPHLSDIYLNYVTIRNHYSVGIFIYALPEAKANNIQFNHVYINADLIKATRGYTAAMMADACVFYGEGIFLRHVDHVHFNKVEMDRIGTFFNIEHAEHVTGL